MKSASAYALEDTLIADLPDNKHDLERLQGDHAILNLPEVKDIPGQEHIRVMPLGEMADITASSADEEGAGLLDFDETTADEEEDEDSIMIDTDDEDDIAGEDIAGEDADTIDEDDPDADYGEDDFITGDDTDEFDDEDLDDEDLDDEELEEDEADEDDDDLPRAQTLAGDVNTPARFAAAADDEETMDATISDEEISLLENAGPVEADSDTDNLNRSRLDNTDFDGDVLNEVTSTQNVDGNDLDVPGAELDDTNEAVGEEDEENNVYSMSDSE